jgi:mannose-1-phosphate guanylyltransferase
MNEVNRHTWAVVLAAGDGRRLSRLTTDADGTSVPKQFCSLNGGPSLLHEAMGRALTLVPRERLAVIVAAQHDRWWRQALRSHPARNTIVQPRNRGTANGILLPLLAILRRDPLARIAFLPSDHFVRDETTLSATLKSAVAHLRGRSGEIVLLGISPDEADPELGYIVPGGHSSGGAAPVGRFVEKPDAPVAQSLIAAGAVWNSFIFVADGNLLLSLFRRRFPEIVDDMETALARDGDVGGEALAALYTRLRDVDFSRHVLQGAEQTLRVLAVPPCGWSDLGTPRRVAATINRLASSSEAPGRRGPPPPAAWLNLAAAQARLQLAG